MKEIVNDVYSSALTSPHNLRALCAEKQFFILIAVLGARSEFLVKIAMPCD